MGDVSEEPDVGSMNQKVTARKQTPILMKFTGDRK
jgi:hypothetical protein